MLISGNLKNNFQTVVLLKKNIQHIADLQYRIQVRNGRKEENKNGTEKQKV